MFGRRGRHPVRQERSEVDERIAERARLPVQQRHDAIGHIGIEQEIVRLEVTVHDTGAPGIGGNPFAQPGGSRFDFRHVGRFEALPPLGQRAHLPHDEAGRPAKVAQAGAFDVHAVQACKRIDQGGTYPMTQRQVPL
jgi:hypothetical protein